MYYPDLTEAVKHLEQQYLISKVESRYLQECIVKAEALDKFLLSSNLSLEEFQEALKGL
jgi:hypothetical protein